VNYKEINVPEHGNMIVNLESLAFPSASLLFSFFLRKRGSLGG